MTTEELYWLDQLLDVDEGLSPWELTFIESLDEKRHFRLSVKQHEILEKLYERLC